jgi:hypothetical protein
MMNIQSIIENLKNIRLEMTGKGDTIMHIAAVLDKKMSCFLHHWDK